jgi:hypothetical protein
MECSFGELEVVLGFALPPSSRRHLAHWYGAGGSRVAAALRDAGWRARFVDIVAERLILEPGQYPPESTVSRGNPRTVANVTMHEGTVVAAVVRYLMEKGWTIKAVADVVRKERGDDIRAERDGAILVVEAKGYPSREYADPRRAGEKKPTHPSLQAKHWLSNALLTALVVQGTRAGALVAIALPHTGRYESLVSSMESPLRRLGIGVLFVDIDGAVSERLPWRNGK